MVAQTKSLVEITQTAIQVLVRELGPVDAVRFVNQFSIGHGDYTEERDALFADMTLDDIIKRVKESRQKSD
jgi:hypothetical protein